ncbi:glycosyltransferase [Paenibacillus polymyxa]|uniref:glycosyltransferase n=1 Tax=Paenibacillus polymyxa TaxID=1406 RepID=UPI0023790015|nr:glycosyltransferase [Paenibacillus polymyxa]WDM21638.1 tetratricopeptide repeat protein [Paenibacillus polymyxa]
MNKTISLCMIVKNEEKVLDRCLSSVENKVDEIIIIDTGSTDSTMEIARKYTEKVYSYHWADDFAAARNRSLEYAQSNYILVLDADEYLESNADLKTVVGSGKDYYLIRIRNLLSFGWAHTHTAIRLFVNKPQLKYKNRLHEHLDTMNENYEYSNEMADFVILHTGYMNETLAEKDKLSRNLPIMLKEVAENPNGYNLFNTGNVYYSLGNYKKAIEYYQRSYPLSKDKSYTPELLTRIATCLSYLDKHEEGLRVLEDAVEIFPNTVDLRYAQGKIYFEAGYFKDAELTFKKCIMMGDKGITVTEGAGGYGAHYYLSLLYYKKGELAKSYDEIIKVIQEKKLFVPGLNHYFEIILKGNIPFEDVKQNINNIYNISNVEELRWLMESMYSLRHPLLNEYLNSYNLTVEDKIRAVALLFDKKYEESKHCWEQISVGEENALDVLVLATILNDQKLFQLIQPLLNLSNKEQKTLYTFLMDGKNDKKPVITTRTEKIIMKVITHLISLQEFDVFEKVSTMILKSDVDINIRLGEVLVNYGFNEVAIDVLSKCFERQPRNSLLVRLLGDVCLKSGYLQDAQLFYNKLLELKPEYSSYERCFNLYEAAGLIYEMRVIKEEIKHKFEIAQWVKP